MNTLETILATTDVAREHIRTLAAYISPNSQITETESDSGAIHMRITDTGILATIHSNINGIIILWSSDGADVFLTGVLPTDKSIIERLNTITEHRARALAVTE